ncbi:response regulator [Cohnella lupini]|uniref:AraC family two component transcriptional regulator n=1 Tax=Cohnella lupini TaxID=1294267 RepID=A0A3D9ILA7_9BACL|nr:response regulator [Cohnella lupini]RED61886.1 AraC family two component transcriptional regulator [Cohnella lupini]
MKLLIVDDEEHLVECMVASLSWSEVGITDISTAYSGKQALDVMEDDPADLVITDVRMPGLNGIELIGAIKSRWPGTVCMMLSGHAEFEYVQEGLKHKVSHYLLKPVKDEELIAAVREAVDGLLAEKEQLRTYIQSQSSIHRNLPVLRANLLNNLIQGRSWNGRKLAEELNLYDIPVRVGDEVSLILIRIEDRKRYYGTSDLPVMGFAVTNIVEELLADGYGCWSCEDLYGHLLIVVNNNPEGEKGQSLERLADESRRIVNQLLRLTVSVILSPTGVFPENLEELYQRCVTTVRSQIGNDNDIVVRLNGENSRVAPHVVKSLYTPPLLAHLLEAGNWTGAREKLEEIFREWSSDYRGSNEHLSEIDYAIKAAFSYFVHKNGRMLADYRLHKFEDLKGDDELKHWASSMLDKLQEEMNAELSDSRHSLVSQIQQFIQEHLSEDVSLQAIADHVFLHPTHISKVFKKETGENITDYLLRLRMEKAVFLLKDSKYKVYEVAGMLGYKNPTYFIKVFKEHFSVTPQEFRE